MSPLFRTEQRPCTRRSFSGALSLLLVGGLSLLLGGCAEQRTDMDPAVPVLNDSTLTLTSVLPRSWPTTGNIEIQLRGSGFQPTSVVTIGGKAAPVVAAAADSLTVMLPERLGGVGPARIAVQNPDGTRAAADDLFSYSASVLQFPNEVVFSGSTNARSVVVSDINRDGAPDVMVTALPTTILVSSSDKRGRLVPSVPVNVVGSSLGMMVGADFNGDGNLDLAATVGASGYAISLGSSGGVFNAPTTVPVSGANVAALVAVDLNGDARIDLVIADVQTNSVRVFLGDGTGSFTPGAVRPLGAMPNALLAADLNADGKLDVISANRTSTASVLLGDGIGGLGAATTIPTVDPPLGMTTGDINGDGRIDLIMVSNVVVPLRQNLGVLLGDGKGGFAAVQTTPLGVTPNLVLAEDLNRDGKLDIIVGGPDLRVFLGNGTATLGSSYSITAAGTFTLAATLADMDLDGKVDAVIGNGAVLKGDGTGRFESVPFLDVAAPPARPIVADLNEDGRPDLIVPPIASIPISILLSSGTGYLPAQWLDAGLAYAAGEVADLNGDGHVDLVVLTNSTAQIGSFDSISVLLGDGTGSFTPHPAPPIPGRRPSAVVIRDFDQDKKLDLAISNAAENTVHVLLGDGTGGFFPPSIFAVGTSPKALVAEDFDRDGKLDLAVANQGSDDIILLKGDGAGGFFPQARFATPSTPVTLLSADADLDGNLDLVVGGMDLGLLLGDGMGGFKGVTRVDTGVSGGTLTVADVNGDRVLDVLCAPQGPDGNYRLLLGLGGGLFAPPRRFFGVQGSGPPVVVDMNQDGLLDLVLSSSSGQPGRLLILTNASR